MVQEVQAAAQTKEEAAAKKASGPNKAVLKDKALSDQALFAKRSGAQSAQGLGRGQSCAGHTHSWTQTQGWHFTASGWLQLRSAGAKMLRVY